jgi:iron(III) transport system substrate-binding protein
MTSVLTTMVLLGLGAIVFSLDATAVWGQIDDKAKLVEGAKKEGKLVWYTSTNVTESKPLLDDFEKQYPFVKGEIFRASRAGPQFNQTIKEFREVFGL